MTDTPDPQDIHRALGRELAALLGRAGMSGKDAAARLGWQPSKISRLANAKQMPSADDLEQLAEICEATDHERGNLRELLKAAQTDRRQWRSRVRSGMGAVQLDYNRLYAESTRIRAFETVAIPGPLQIRAYATRIITEMAVNHSAPQPYDVDAAVSARLQRAQYLYEPGKQFTFILAEPVLRWGFCPPEVMRAQLDRLLTATELPSVTLAVLPLDRPMPIIPQHAFQLYDDIVTVATTTAEIVCRDDEAAIYARLFDQFLDAALTGEDALGLIAATKDRLLVS